MKKELDEYKKKEMDTVFIEMFGEKYARSFYLLLGSSANAYLQGDEDKETKKECISGLLLSVLEYYKNQDTVWYEQYSSAKSKKGEHAYG